MAARRKKSKRRSQQRVKAARQVRKMKRTRRKRRSRFLPPKYSTRRSLRPQASVSRLVK